ncbi:MAG: tyrosine--tRNA ligase [Candidatus Omnitrophica bacterium CG08_land_8_20_14_0_20_41_16]|uniref:Tyrosine--tRNA ligase n=1 Tax=Candidatus Sherwoodlollariibacterium unditelluris TaxID=1974757 RepID=A0A2G9YIV9_9BACT|nr:MAG: tyrosine--tRNA ligase [Candidatus Omnitrophica bacterium CG23_combo_of_CG06-09_8_20_14_all_41_10]PIS34197.1 MAG: tyrosine--tRNA ligase [Candidatus Omnitrophica bacterium CG08_land_8_20_14_0_20_41_16]
MQDINKQLEIIKRGAAEIISEEELRKKLEESIKNRKPLKIKAGFDPTAPDLHLGHTVLLRKLRQFQDLGHEVYFLIGDFTGQIGDPSGRSETRKQLTKEEVFKNARTYKKQAAKILDISKLKIVFNSKWFERMSIVEMLRLTIHLSVSQMLSRDDFKKRYTKGENISILEFMYPLMQGYDSVVLKADVELGGTDQIFNLLVGRQFQKDFNQPEQVVITMPLLEGTDGVQKMSKSFDNYIGINEPAKDIFGKIMSISDELMLKYYELLTDEDLARVKNMHPKDAKVNLARIIVSQYHSQADAEKETLEFQRVFSLKEIPVDMPEYKTAGEKSMVIILTESRLAASGNEARRLIKQGAVSFNNIKVGQEGFIPKEPGILKVGSRRFLKVVL